MLDTRALRHFVAVAQELHFGRAAKRLNISQPPLSISIRQLEERMGVRLFARTQRVVELTPAGQVLLEKAVPILRQLEEAETATQGAAKGYQGQLRIGYTAASAYEVVPKVMAAFQARYPHVELLLQEMVSTQQLAGLRQDQLDVGILRPTQVRAPLRSVCLLHENLVVALPASHPLAAQSAISLRQLHQAAFIAFSLNEAPYFNAMVEEVLHRARVQPRIVQRATQTHAVVALVAAGLGVALVPQTCERIRIENLVFRPIAEAIETGAEVHLCWNRDSSAPLVQNFVTTSVEALGATA